MDLARDGERPSRETDILIGGVEEENGGRSRGRHEKDGDKVDRPAWLLGGREPAAALFIEPRRLDARPPADRIAGMVVRVPGLALEGEKGGDPPVGAGEPEEQAAVMPHAVVTGVAAGAWIALVHVNVVDAAIGLELEGCVGLVLGTPGLAEGEDHCVRIGQRPLDLRVDHVVEVVAVTRQVGRQQAHVLGIEQMAADVVEPAIFQAGRNRVETLLELLDGRQDRMAEIIDDPIEEKRSIRPAAALVARFDVDRDTPRLARRHDLDLVMGRCAIAPLLGRSDRPPAQHPVFRLAHHFLLVGILGSRDVPNRDGK